MTPLEWKDIQRTAAFSSDRATLLLGDASTVLSTMPPASVDTCVTSPPYWGVRDYEEDDQIGHEDSVEAYVENLASTFDNLHRVLKPTGSVWLNIGDKYLSGVGTVGGLPPPRGWKRNKQLALVPFRLALALEDRGWWVRNTLVWHKPNGMPISASDRLANHWEPVFLLTKSERYYFDLDAIREPHKTDDDVERKRAEAGANQGFTSGSGHLRKWLNSPRHRANIDGLRDIERRPYSPDAVELAAYLRAALKPNRLSIHEVAARLDQPFERVRHYFRTDAIGSRLPPHETWLALKEMLALDSRYDEAMTVEIGDNAFRNHPKGRNPGDVRSIGIGPNDTGHLATMPLRLAEWCLRATLPKNGVCIDPFMGSGTSGLAAINLGGRFVGIDLSIQFVAAAGRRLEALQSVDGRFAAE